MAFERVLLVTHNVANHFHPCLVRHLGAAFEGLGFETHVFLPELDGRGGAEFVSALDRFSADGPERSLLIDVNARVRLAQAEPFRRFSVIIDHAYQHLERIRALPEATVLGFIDQDSPGFLAGLGLRFDSIFLPHAAPAPLAPPPPLQGREIDILFSGRLEQANRMSQLQALVTAAPPPVARAVVSLTEQLIGGAEVSAAFPEALAAEGLAPGQFDDESITQVVGLAESFAGARVRRSVLEALDGLPVTVIGAVSDDFFERMPEGFTWLGPQSFEAVLGALDSTKICLNLMGGKPTASHERMFYANRAGNLLACDGNAYVRDVYEDGRSCVFLTPEDARDRIGELLNNPARAQEIADGGLAVLNRGQTWKVRALAILDALGEAPLA